MLKVEGEWDGHLSFLSKGEGEGKGNYDEIAASPFCLKGRVVVVGGPPFLCV